MTRPSQPETVRVRYLGPTDTIGSRLVVTWRGRRRSLGFNYAASDAMLWAASEVTGYPEAALQRSLYRDPDNRVYEVIDPKEERAQGR